MHFLRCKLSYSHTIIKACKQPHIDDIFCGDLLVHTIVNNICFNVAKMLYIVHQNTKSKRKFPFCGIGNIAQIDIPHFLCVFFRL